ncbi:hypothetical protein EPUS_02290 [Endocarpon pusillum Z07020]|uniref:F-box domain-containing protein n=1 Tax=Endocarpon pusillum (strain Z07020 / HMAS-L-300199) TaxID=1263415 RepID=U1GXA9_ENDPU|nr:uncharacterized protein EPUS_02290 [Endocarpon pusillum Z07020]ERF76751.1 hypothetical protein EPUS_02290 [Endocarpon pusillum Z07020]
MSSLNKMQDESTFSRPSSNSTIPLSTSKALSSGAEAAPVAKLSPTLACLPAEVLQKILQHSLELNLVLTCKNVAKRMPGFWWLARILMLASFCAYPAALFLDASWKEAGAMLGLRLPIFDGLDRRLLQGIVMDRGWWTLDMLKSAMAEI